jgi:hypothetical protein
MIGLIKGISLDYFTFKLDSKILNVMSKKFVAMDFWHSSFILIRWYYAIQMSCMSDNSTIWWLMSYFSPNCNSSLNFMSDSVYDLDHVQSQPI